MLANYSLHCIGGVNQDDIPADYFGLFSQRIGELLEAESRQLPLAGLLNNSTSGNINNINFRQSGERYQPYEKMTQVAELVAARVKKAHDQTTHHD